MDFFFTMDPDLKKKHFFSGGGDGGSVGRHTDKQAQTYLPLQLLRRWGHNNA